MFTINIIVNRNMLQPQVVKSRIITFKDEALFLWSPASYESSYDKAKM